MVSRDIHKMSIEELTGVVGAYPWFSAARRELCWRMAGLGMLSEAQVAEAAVHLGSRRILRSIVEEDRRHQGGPAMDASSLASDMLSSERDRERKVIVTGGDYFSQTQYDNVRKADDNAIREIVRKAVSDNPKEADNEAIGDFCTETLAQIYLEQDYPEQAIDIYSKLSLRYPEKSVYFAALIDEINKKK